MSMLLCEVNFLVGIACTIKVYQNSRIICQHHVRDIKSLFVLGLVDKNYIPQISVLIVKLIIFLISLVEGVY